MASTNVEKGIANSGVTDGDLRGALMQQVKVYDGEGNLKKIIPPKDLLRNLYKQEGVSLAPFPSKENPQSETKYGTAKCVQCKKVFNKTHKEMKFCKRDAPTEAERNKCYRAYYRRKVARETFDIKCKTCKTIFRGTKGRVYCNNPCNHNRYEKYDLPESDNCTMCGSPFKPKQKQSRFCGNPCNFERERNEIRRIKRLHGEIQKTQKEIEKRKIIIAELTAENEDLDQMLCSMQKSRENRQDSKHTETMCG